MKSAKLLGLGLLIAGVVLLYFGYNASQSVAESLTEAVTGRFTDETMFLLLGGAVATGIGLFMLLRN